MNFDVVSRNSQKFLDAEIEGLFKTHLVKAANEEVHATNKRTARCRARPNGKSRKNSNC